MITHLWWRLLRFGFRLLYNELAFAYDVVSKVVSLGAWRCWQRAALEFVNVQENDQILEIGHGTGDLQIDLSNAGFDVVGYDLSPYMGRIAREKLRRNRIPANLVQGFAQNLPFPANTFSVVVSTFPSEFILQPDTIAEVARVLRQGGGFVIVLNGQLVGGGAVKSFLEWLFRITGQRENESSCFEKLLTEYNFEVERFERACKHSVAQIVVCAKLP